MNNAVLAQREPQLTAKQDAFVRWYTSAEVNMNGTEAARRAGYRGNNDTLRVVASENLAKPYIRRQVDSKLKAVLSNANITIEKVLQDIQHVQTLALSSGQLSVALRCSELQGKYLGMFSDKADHSPKVEEVSLSQLIELANQLSKVIPGLLLAQPDTRE